MVEAEPALFPASGRIALALGGLLMIAGWTLPAWRALRPG
jgi:uncharacterized membrane protein YgdD (TMEM256/DUF423 family)